MSMAYGYWIIRRLLDKSRGFEHGSRNIVRVNIRSNMIITEAELDKESRF